jgi:hypothetical protein
MNIPNKYLGECKNNRDICAPELVGGTKGLSKLKKETSCNDEQCVVLNKYGKEEIKKYWKPDGPVDSSWLSNYDIDDVLSWWADDYPDFIHIPFQTIDFMEYPNALSDFDMSEHDGKCAGVVINTDVRSGQGIHWFCLFLDMRSKPHQIEYFNSEGTMPHKTIGEFCRKQLIFCKSKSKNCEIIIASSIRHQYSHSECGPYSLYYIYSRINGVKSDAFGREPISDEYMKRFRKAIFRKS